MLVYALDGADVAVGSFTVTNSDVSSHGLSLGVELAETLKIEYVHGCACLLQILSSPRLLSERNLLIATRDLRLLPRSKLDLRSSGKLRSLDW